MTNQNFQNSLPIERLLNQWRRVADALPPARRARLLATIGYISAHVYHCNAPAATVEAVQS